jgi:hypothetical protein
MVWNGIQTAAQCCGNRLTCKLLPALRGEAPSEDNGCFSSVIQTAAQCCSNRLSTGLCALCGEAPSADNQSSYCLRIWVFFVTALLSSGDPAAVAAVGCVSGIIITSLRYFHRQPLSSSHLYPRYR